MAIPMTLILRYQTPFFWCRLNFTFWFQLLKFLWALSTWKLQNPIKKERNHSWQVSKESKVTKWSFSGSLPNFSPILIQDQVLCRSNLLRVLEQSAGMHLFSVIHFRNSPYLALSWFVLVIPAHVLSFGLMSLEGVQCFDWKSHFYSGDELNEHGGGFIMLRRAGRRPWLYFLLPSHFREVKR